MKWFFAFSPKASKSAVLQAGLLTYPLFSPFPPCVKQDSGYGKKYSGLTAAGTVQELQQLRLTCFPFNPPKRNLLAGKGMQKNRRLNLFSASLSLKFINQ
jgi:hypothetical protein